ncbi:hypothetical protein NRK68_33825 (plasmid) [Streptomyces yangpuensis]|uniref:Uncharacterized protein n=1 Tax=Streptomyces yangpuensis TaxID=1648182 RepID=A0ABY5Q703_9ACTN|nr:hypothetical protein [Streptomyces yangpuensis]UUY52267.1 hypothetical protein NRK68_33825 [Streptomyces yangpuensis]
MVDQTLRDLGAAHAGSVGVLLEDGSEPGPAYLALARARDHVFEMHPGANVPKALRLVSDVAYPPADCPDVAGWVAQYNARNGTQAWGPR